MPSSVQKKVDAFFSKFPERIYQKNQILILADENPKHIYYLVKGQVREYDISHKGDEVVVNVFKPPAFFPMSWAINKTPNRYFFEALAITTARLAPPEDVTAFIKESPDVMYNLLSRLYSGTDGLLRRMAHLMGGGARSRLIFELIVESRRFGQPRRGGHLIMMSESELGARAGLSRETVSREINDLKKAGLLDIDRRGITIKDIKALESELGSGL